MSGLKYGYVSADELAELEAEYGMEEEPAASPDDWWNYWQNEY